MQFLRTQTSSLRCLQLRYQGLFFLERRSRKDLLETLRRQTRFCFLINFSFYNASLLCRLFLCQQSIAPRSLTKAFKCFRLNFLKRLHLSETGIRFASKFLPNETPLPPP